MSEQENKAEPSAQAPQAENNSIAIDKIEVGGDVSGSITIGNTGYTVEEDSVLITQITSTFQPKPFDGRCPYKGLDVFEEEDAKLFFGREKLVDDLVSRVRMDGIRYRPSGRGKSSLGRAWTLLGSRKNLKPRLREMLENRARRKAAVPSVQCMRC